MWERQEEGCQELWKVIKYMSEKGRRAFDSDGTKEEVVKRSTESRELDP